MKLFRCDLQETSLLPSMSGALHNLFEFLEDFVLDRCKGREDVATGDVVVCFDDDGTLMALGTVKHVGKTKLAKDHSDGTFGEVFVLPFSKARYKRGTPLNRACVIYLINSSI